MSSKKERSGSRTAWAIWLAVGGVFVVFLSILFALHTFAWARTFVVGNGVRVDQLGQLGDSFGPVTSVFAAIAAIGAWLSYSAQREQLEQERSHRRGTRFDEIFFRLVDFYESELAKVAYGTVAYLKADSTRGFQDNTGIAAIRFFRKVVETRRKGHPSDTGPFSYLWAMEEMWRNSQELESVFNFSRQLVAITDWLRSESFGIAVSRRAALLSARLSNDEIWLWGLAIADEGSDDLFDFARRLGIIGEGGEPPKKIGTGRVFNEYDLREDIVARDTQRGIAFERARAER